jgi:16S rRNA (guanine527-N7)-methyltransferase
LKPLDLLIDGANHLGLEIHPEEAALFMLYAEELKQYNKLANLTSITNDNEIMVKHFLDSLTCLLIKDFDDTATLIDVGTGAGFPGIPLKVLRRHIKLTLMDSTKKKIVFLRHITEMLGINVEIIEDRAEKFGRSERGRESYDVVVSRAVAPMNVLAEYCLPLAKLGGMVVFLKGPNIEDEYNEAKRAFSACGGVTQEIKTLKLPYDAGTRNLIVVKKMAKTPERYPRRPGIPSKKPII